MLYLESRECALAAQIRPRFHCSLGEMTKVPEDPSRARRKWMPICGLLLLCLIWALGWVRADLSPGRGTGIRLNPLWSEAVLLGSFAVISGVAGAASKRRWPIRTEIGKAVVIGVGLFVVPAVLNTFIKERIEDTTRVALFSLTPLFAVIFERHLRTDEEQAETRGGFLASMAAVAGTFLVFPVELPQSYGSALAMLAVIVAAAAVALANCVGVETVQRRGVCSLTLAAMSAGSAAMLLGIAGLIALRIGTSTVALDAWAVSDVLALANLFWLMRQMSATQMTTRFLIAPLIANLISLALLRPHVQVLAWIGLLLIAAGSGWMLCAPKERGDTPITIGVGE